MPFSLHFIGPNATDVSSHIHRLECRFRLLHERIQSELVDCGIELPRLLSSLKVIPTELRQEYNMSIHEVFPELRSEPGIREAFYHLSPLIDFLSCGLLNFIIGEFGSNTLKAMMKSYDVDLIRFMKETRVKQLMDVWPGQQAIPPNFSKLRAKLDQDPASYTLYDLDRLRRQFCGAVRLTEIVLVIIGLESANSFIAEWIVPSTLIPLLMEFVKKLDSGYYIHEHILEMTVDEIQIFPILPDAMSKSPAPQASAATATVIYIFNTLIPKMIGEVYNILKQDLKHTALYTILYGHSNKVYCFTGNFLSHRHAHECYLLYN